MVKNYVAIRRCYGYLGKVLMQNTTRRCGDFPSKQDALTLQMIRRNHYLRNRISTDSQKSMYDNHYNRYILQQRQRKGTKKSDPKVALEREEGLFALLCLALLCSRRFFFIYSFVEFCCYENYTVVLNTLGILPFLWLEIAFYSKESSLDEAVEG